MNIHSFAPQRRRAWRKGKIIYLFKILKRAKKHTCGFQIDAETGLLFFIQGLTVVVMVRLRMFA